MSKNETPKTLLDYAREQDSTVVVEMLLKAGADPNRRDADTSSHAARIAKERDNGNKAHDR